MLKRTPLVSALTVASLTLALTMSAPAAAHEVHDAHAAHHGMAVTGTAPAAPEAQVAGGTFFFAFLKGENEVPAADPDGRGIALIRIRGTQVCYTFQWARVEPPTASHIHLAPVGVSGPIVVGFFGRTTLPETLNGVTGCVTASSQTLADDIIARPGEYYTNLHSATYPNGSIRGQLRKLDRGVDLLRPFRGELIALLDGDQEFPNSGDPDGRATGFVRTHGPRVDFGFVYSGIAPPVVGHVHPGAVGAAGPPVVPLFSSTTGGLPPSVIGIAGTVRSDAATVRRINRHPSAFYLNLHNAEFPEGAVRGQLFRAG